MQNRREYCVYFQRSTDSGIAKITVYNETLDKYVAADGSLSDVEVSRLCDLYVPSSYGLLERPLIYRVTLEGSYLYTITVEHSGTHNASASSPYYVTVLKYFNVVSWVDGRIFSKMLAWHSDHNEVKDFLFSSGSIRPIEDSQKFDGDGSNRTFVLSGTNRADVPLEFSRDGGATWLAPTSSLLTWGQNSPDYDDEAVDANGRIGVVFDFAPDIGTENVIIRYRCKVNKYRIQEIVYQPTDETGTIKDLNNQVVQHDYSVEFLRG